MKFKTDCGWSVTHHGDGQLLTTCLIDSDSDLAMLFGRRTTEKGQQQQQQQQLMRFTRPPLNEVNHSEKHDAACIKSV